MHACANTLVTLKGAHKLGGAADCTNSTSPDSGVGPSPIVLARAPMDSHERTRWRSFYLGLLVLNTIASTQKGLLGASGEKQNGLAPSLIG